VVSHPVHEALGAHAVIAVSRQHRFTLIRLSRAVLSPCDWSFICTTHAIARSQQRTNRSFVMDELNGRMIACQILITGLIARVANTTPDPLRFLSDFRDEIRAVVKGVNIAGMDNTDRVRLVAQQTVDELFSLMKPPSSD